jgi:hypothetical protein
MSSDKILLTQNALTESLNVAIESYTKQLVTENIITPEQAEQAKFYRVVVMTPNFWGKVWAKILKQNGDFKMCIVKICD